MADETVVIEATESNRMARQVRTHETHVDMPMPHTAREGHVPLAKRHRRHG